MALSRCLRCGSQAVHGRVFYPEVGACLCCGHRSYKGAQFDDGGEGRKSERGGQGGFKWKKLEEAAKRDLAALKPLWDEL